MRQPTTDHPAAVIYARTASTSPADHVALDQQLHACSSTAKRLGARIERAFTDVGVSGLTANRPGLNALLEHLLGSDIEMMIIADDARLARRHDLFIDLREQLAAHGCVVLLADVTGDEDRGQALPNSQGSSL